VGFLAPALGGKGGCGVVGGVWGGGVKGRGVGGGQSAGKELKILFFLGMDKY